MAAPRGKRPASLPLPVAPANKKGRKSLQAPPPSQSPAQSAAGEEVVERPAGRGQKGGKEASAKKAVDEKVTPAQQAKKEERFSLRPRERVGGPITRSLQQAAAPPADGRPEDPTHQDPRETPQEAATKLAR